MLLSRHKVLLLLLLPPFSLPVFSLLRFLFAFEDDESNGLQSIFRAVAYRLPIRLQERERESKRDIIASLDDYFRL